MNPDDRPQLWGWVLFLLSAVAFTAMGVRDGDALLVVGSLLFLVACVVFVVDLLR